MESNTFLAALTLPAAPAIDPASRFALLAPLPIPASAAADALPSPRCSL